MCQVSHISYCTQAPLKSIFKPRLHERFFACDGDAIFLKIVASPARGENRKCSHPRTGDATDEKIAEKNREKFNELNFLRQNHGLRQRVATQAIFAARWRHDNFQKIASPSQAKNRSCSRGFKEHLCILCCKVLSLYICSPLEM